MSNIGNPPKVWNPSDNVINTDLNNDFSTIYNDYNGNITDFNCAPAMNLQPTKILNTAMTLTGASAQACTQPTAFSLPRWTLPGNTETVASAASIAFSTALLGHIITGTTTISTITGGLEGQLALLLITGNLTLTHTATDTVNSIHTKTQANRVITASAANPLEITLLCTKFNGNWTNLQWLEI